MNEETHPPENPLNANSYESIGAANSPNEHDFDIIIENSHKKDADTNPFKFDDNDEDDETTEAQELEEDLEEDSEEDPESVWNHMEAQTKKWMDYRIAEPDPRPQIRDHINMLREELDMPLEDDQLKAMEQQAKLLDIVFRRPLADADNTYNHEFCI